MRPAFFFFFNFLLLLLFCVSFWCLGHILQYSGHMHRHYSWRTQRTVRDAGDWAFVAPRKAGALPAVLLFWLLTQAFLTSRCQCTSRRMCICPKKILCQFHGPKKYDAGFPLSGFIEPGRQAPRDGWSGDGCSAVLSL